MFRSPVITLTALLFAAGLHGELSAQPELPDEVEVTATVAESDASAGSEVTLQLELGLADGSHANSNRPRDPNLIATTFFPKGSDDFSWGKIRYPNPTQVIEWYSVDPLPVFENGAVIQVPLTISEQAGAEASAEGTLRVQVCDAEQCYPPERVPVKVKLIPAAQ